MEPIKDPKLPLPEVHSWTDVTDVYFLYITDKKDRDNIQKAYDFAKLKHEGQFRKSGLPYIHHLIEVAYILASLNAGPSTIIAGLLHDVVEDTDCTVNDIQKEWGKDVAMIVDSVTKIQRLKLSKKGDDSSFVYEDHRKIFLGMAKDIRVIIIKLADRLHNLRTLYYLKPERQLAIAKETMAVYAPIAGRLGMGKIKAEMEDLSLKYIEPDVYYHVLELVEQKSPNLQKALTEVSKRIADILYKNNIKFEMKFRVKSIYSIYKKMKEKDNDFDKIYDLMALRIITPTELNCYEILGLIHATYRPVTGRFKDYIAMPKSNMYQSLHTTIFSGDGNALEVQIRTPEMDQIADSGVAAHWAYKEGTNYNPEKEQREIENKLHWLRDFVGISYQTGDNAKEYMETLTKEIFETSVYVFTPKGNVVELPSGATPLDFAYKIHTKVGDSAVGALVNDKLVAMNTPLKTGDICEIRTSKTATGPTESWLNIATTNSARNHIRKVLARKNQLLTRDENIEKGRGSLNDAFKERGFAEHEVETHVNKPQVLKHFEVSDFNELLLLVYSRNVTPSSILDYLKLDRRDHIGKMLSKGRKVEDAKNPVLVPGAGTVAVTLGNCCTPIPGDEIVGYITKGKGITVHRVTCPNIAKVIDRAVEVFWNPNSQTKLYPLDLSVKCLDRDNLLVDIMNALSQAKVTLSKIKATYHPTTRTSVIDVTILIGDLTQLSGVQNIIGQIDSVYKIERVFH
ncbi:MAG: bifunctional (p)ppGpp synthetase/guanosine-3',5'-bis(diphosphate) 3'-pyrophosphohydrolase [Bacilli bacterium]|nr:bifunctional (p)ppGpp synthetase/guanosine-3',5'-bis(diphosphate) 3'-pyrophosphohydrolase [Bacilli bacterium]